MSLLFLFFFPFEWAARPSPTQTQQNIPPPTATEIPPAQAAPGREPAEDLDADKDDVDVFLVESVEVDVDEEVDADEEMPQSTVAAPVQGNSSPWKNGGKGRWGNGEAKHTELHEDRRELEPSDKAVEKAPETNPEMASQRLCSIVLSSPIHFPRKQKLAEDPKVPLDKPAEQPAGKAHKKVGENNPVGE